MPHIEGCGPAMSAKRTNLKPNLKPRRLAYARDVALLNLAVAILTGYEVHILQAGQRYAVLGDDNYSLVAVRNQAARCITCKKPCLCAEIVTMWRRRLTELGAKP